MLEIYINPSSSPAEFDHPHLEPTHTTDENFSIDTCSSISKTPYTRSTSPTSELFSDMSSESFHTVEGTRSMPTSPSLKDPGHGDRRGSFNPEAAPFNMPGAVEEQGSRTPMNPAQDLHLPPEVHNSGGSASCRDPSVESSQEFPGQYAPGIQFSPATTHEQMNWNGYPLFHPEQQYFGYSYLANPADHMNPQSAYGMGYPQDAANFDYQMAHGPLLPWTHGYDPHGYGPHSYGPMQHSINPYYAQNQGFVPEHSDEGHPPLQHHDGWEDIGIRNANTHRLRNEDFGRYPNPDDIRESVDLIGLARAIPISRRQNALSGAGLDVLEERIEERVAERTVNGTAPSTIMFYNVPKKALILFCGRKKVSRLLRTIEREDNKNWVSKPTQQQLRVPQGSCNHVGLKIFVSWIRKACDPEFAGNLHRIKCPEDTFSAVSLARTLRLFDLKKDAKRIEQQIWSRHFKRPLSPDTVEQIWKAFPKNCMYTYRMIKSLKLQIDLHLCTDSDFTMPEANEMRAVIAKYPALKVRVQVEGENEKFKPAPKDVHEARIQQAQQHKGHTISNSRQAVSPSAQADQIPALSEYVGNLSIAELTPTNGTMTYAQVSRAPALAETNAAGEGGNEQPQGV
jgi:hypothetical protein